MIIGEPIVSHGKNHLLRQALDYGLNGINCILPDLAGGNSSTVANSRTNAKGIPLYEIFEFVHTANLDYLNNLCNPELFR